MRSSSKLAVIGCATLAITSGFSTSAAGDPVLFTNGAYLSQADSPFNGSNFSYFFLENFEDALLNVLRTDDSLRPNDEADAASTYTMSITASAPEEAQGN